MPGTRNVCDRRNTRRSTVNSGQRRAGWPWLNWPLVLAWACWASLAAAHAQQTEPAGQPNEATVKAVYLYSFGRYIEWPKETVDDSRPFIIGVVGPTSVSAELETIATKKTLRDRRIVLRKFASAAEFVGPCHIVFVSGEIPAADQLALLRKTQSTPILFVGEIPGFAANGGGANFYLDGDRVRFEINIEALRRSELRVDARFLSLAKHTAAPRGNTP